MKTRNQVVCLAGVGAGGGEALIDIRPSKGDLAEVRTLQSVTETDGPCSPALSPLVPRGEGEFRMVAMRRGGPAVA